MKASLKAILAALAVSLPLVASAQAPAAEPAKPADAAAPATPAATPAPAAPAVKLTWYGIAHTSVYSTSAAASSTVYAGTATQNGGRGSLVIASNASRLGLRLDMPEALGAKLAGVFEMDFRGGWTTQNPSAFYNSAMRIRKAYGSATWKSDMGSFGMGAGQEFTVVAPLAGASTVYLADQVFTNAGNANRRTPQIRVFGDVGVTDQISVTGVAALLHPVDIQATTDPTQGQGVRGRRPDLEARLGLQYKMDKKTVVDVGAGYGMGKEYYELDGEGVFLDKSLIAVDAKVDLGIVLVQGEWFTAKNADSYFVNFASPARATDTDNPEGNGTSGFWGQVVVTPIPLVQLVGGYGTETPDDADLGNSETAVTKNVHIMGGIILNPSKNWQAGVEILNVTTTRGAGTAPETEDKVNQLGFSTRFTF